MATIKSVVATLQAEATAASTTTITVPPKITTHSDEQDKAHHLNVTNQAVIGTKEGTMAAFTKIVGSNITNAVFQSTNRQRLQVDQQLQA